MNSDALLSRVKSGQQLTRVELESVRRTLSDPNSRDDKYTLIHILWKAHDTDSWDFISSHTANSDEMVRRISLQALAALFPTGEVFDLALHLSHDPSKYVRMAAATAIGTLGTRLQERTADAARFLLKNFEQSIGTSEWDSYYEGLLTLAQVPEIRRPLATRELDVKDVDPEVIAKVRALAAGS